ncbi:ATP-binding protein [Gracilibacillus sp. JCM 18860]|uniref:ATP-binding protein n=1 Tax=Gracilibacillus sp. JCM 18860 TaxID=1306159 RepID=UPI0006D018AE
MTIRKRLFISNTAMILVPLAIIILIILLINIVIGGHQKSWGGPPQAQNNELFQQLMRTASLEDDKLLDKQYLASLLQRKESEEIKFAVRKGQDLLYGSMDFSKELPPFGREGYDQVAWLDGNSFAIRQHDFYFEDGSEGSIFLLESGDTFIRYARTFFPFILISLIFLLVLSNVLLSYFTSKSILRPINQLSEASSKIKQDDFDFSIQPTSKDELGKLVQSFDEMRQQLKESKALRDQYENNRKELLANISHDLKTPMTSIIGYVEGIQVGVANTPEKQKRYLNTIYTKAKYMNRLINELFLYSKLDLNRLPFYFENVPVKEFIQDYLEEVENDLIEKGVQLSFDANHIHTKVRLDRDKMVRVLENIINNSIKYSVKQSLRINVALKDQGPNMEVIIKDNGPGVSEEELKSIFNRFYQSEPSRRQGGSGLGLAIAAQIIEAHGGHIWAENVPSGGLRIHFSIRKSNIESGGNHE